MQRHPLLFAMLSASALIAAPTAAYAGDELLNPRTYTSPSGAWSINVKPETPQGDAGAEYSLSHNNENVWTRRLPFSLWDGGITDTGVTAGYAYELGLDGRGWDATSHTFAIIIDDKGEIRLKDARERSEDNSIIACPPPPLDPVSTGVFIDEPSDSFIVRIAGTFSDDRIRWWKYRLDTGEKLGDVIPAQPSKSGQYGFHKEIAASVVPGTSLVLVHWYIADYADAQGTHSATMQLLDLSGSQVWRLDLPREYNGLNEHWSWYYDLVDKGISQIQTGNRRFSITSYSLGRRIEYALERNPDGWSVAEIARTVDRPHSRDEPAAQAAATAAALPLHEIGTIPLGAGAPLNPIRDIHEFSIDAESRIGFIRPGETAGSGDFVLVSGDGRVLREIGLPPHIGGPRDVFSISPTKWLVYRTGLGESSASAWLLDIESAVFKPLPLGLGGIREAKPLPDGGLAVIGGADWVGSSTLIAFDASGAKRWAVELFSPQGICVTTTGDIVALEGIRNTLRYFSIDGVETRTLPLEDAALGALNYPAGIEADAGGGVILHDFNGSPPIRRISAVGKEIAGLQPRYPDGRAFRLFGNVHRSADGHLWSSDSHALLRLAEDGQVDRVLGDRPGEAELARVRCLAVGPDDRIYAVNDRDASVHVFTKTGDPVRVMHPDPTDFGVEVGLGSITIAGEGDVYYFPSGSASLDGGKGYLHFDAAGARVGFSPLLLATYGEEWAFKPNRRERWAAGSDRIALADADGTVIRSITTRPDGNWLGKVEKLAAGPDGSLAVLATDRARGLRGQLTVCIYSPTGEPVRTLTVQDMRVFTRIALSEQAVLLTETDRLQVLPRDGGPARHFVLPSSPGHEAWWTLFVADNGRELWAWNSGATEIHRFDMP